VIGYYYTRNFTKFLR